MTGTVLDAKYEVGDLLGRGGMGEVYAGKHIQLDRRVAIKIVHGELNEHEKFLSRFKREARATARLDHPNAVSVYDFGSFEDGSAYLIMELIEGETLRKTMQAEAPFAIPVVVDFMRQIAGAVGAAHAQGIVHRDLKPDNIMVKVDEAGRRTLKVVDFGLAKILENATILTGQFDMLGTPRYMAPEQFTGDFVDERADVYALGCILFELLANRTPFLGTAMEIACKHAMQPVPTFQSIGVHHDEAIENVVRRALEKIPTDRTASVANLLAELEEACGTSSQSSLASAPSTLHNDRRDMSINQPQTIFRSAVTGESVESHTLSEIGSPKRASADRSSYSTPVTENRPNLAPTVIRTGTTRPPAPAFPPPAAVVTPAQTRPAWVVPAIAIGCVLLIVLAVFAFRTPTSVQSSPTDSSTGSDTTPTSSDDVTESSDPAPASTPSTTLSDTTQPVDTSAPVSTVDPTPATQPTTIPSEPQPTATEPLSAGTPSVEDGGTTLRGEGPAPKPVPTQDQNPRSPQPPPNGAYPPPPYPPPPRHGPPPPRDRRPPPPEGDRPPPQQ